MNNLNSLSALLSHHASANTSELQVAAIPGKAGIQAIHVAATTYPMEGGASTLFDETTYIGADGERYATVGMEKTEIVNRGDVGVALDFLLTIGIDAESIDEGGFTAATWAAAAGNMNALRALDDHGANLDHVSEDGWSPLGISAREGHFDMVKFLINSASAEVNHQDKNGNTPLHLAGAAGHFDVCQLLLDCGAERNIENKGKMTCMKLLQRTMLQQDKNAMHEARCRQRSTEHEKRAKEWNTWRNIGKEDHSHSAHLPTAGGSSVKPDVAPDLRPISPNTTVKRLQYDTEVALKEFLAQQGAAQWHAHGRG